MTSPNSAFNRTEFQIKRWSCVSSVSEIVSRLASECDHFEPFDDTKTYDTQPFSSAYIKDDAGNPLTRCYHLAGYEFTVNDQTFRYVGTQEILNASEMRALQQYCQCSRCQMSWFNICRFFTCSCCVGCLRTYLDGPNNATPAGSVVKRTREYIKTLVVVK